MKVQWVTIVIAAALLVGCKKDKNTNPNDLQCDNEISYATDIAPIMNQNCSTSGCHNQASASSGYVLETHAQISNHATIILNVIQHKSGFSAMPQGAPKLSDEQINAFACWVIQGKLNN